MSGTLERGGSLGTITAALIATPILIAIIVAAVVLLLVIILLSIAELTGLQLPVCTCENVTGLVITSVLTIVATVASYAVTLAAGSVAIALLIAIGAGAFFALLTILVCWLICITQTNCDCIRD